MPPLYPETLTDFRKLLFLSLLGRDHFVRCENEGLLGRFETVAAVLRQLLYNITKLRTTLVAGASSLPLASAAGGLGMFAAASYDAVFFILVCSF